jgi:hypothetical protein
MSKDEQLTRLRAEVNQLRDVLTTTISWIAGSANSPLSVSEAQKLIRMLDR